MFNALKKLRHLIMILFLGQIPTVKVMSFYHFVSCRNHRLVPLLSISSLRLRDHPFLFHQTNIRAMTIPPIFSFSQRAYPFELQCVVQLLSSVHLCDPMDCNTLGFPDFHHLPEVAQTHVHQVGDAIQPSHPPLSPSPPAFNLSQHQGLFQ